MDWYEVSVKRSGLYPFVKVDVKGREWVPIVPISDLHIGARNHRHKEARALRDTIIELDALVILLGDLCENANKNSPGASVYEQTITPDQQEDAIEEYLHPIKDRIIGGITGNHEFRSYKGDGQKMTKGYMKALQLKDRYLGFEFNGAIGQSRSNGSRGYSIYGCHSLSSSKTRGLVMNSVQRDWSFIRSDVLMKAHDHNLGHDDIIVHDFNISNCAVIPRKQHIFLTGNYLGREDSYASQKPLSPKKIGSMVMWFKMNGAEKKISHMELEDGKLPEMVGVK